MREKIEAALSMDEWANRSVTRFDVQPIVVVNLPGDSIAIRIDSSGSIVAEKPGTLAAIMAMANDALPDTDPRKITWALVKHLRDTAYTAADGYSGPTWLADLADALASYLPPESA